MKLIETEFEAKRYRYTQISRDGDVAVYEQRWLGRLNGSVAYEVIVIRSHSGVWIGGKYYPPAETYPSSRRWGELGWTLTNRDRALEKAQELSETRRTVAGATKSRELVQDAF